MQEQCENCRFWLFTGEEGCCRRHAPPALHEANEHRLSLDGPIVWGDWPKTHSDDWCGEYQAEKEVD